MRTLHGSLVAPRLFLFVFGMLCFSGTPAFASSNWCKDNPPFTTFEQAEQECLFQQARTAANLTSAYYVTQCQITLLSLPPTGAGSGSWGYDYQLVGQTLPPPPNWVQQWGFYCAPGSYDPNKNKGAPAGGTQVGDPINAGTADLYSHETDLSVGRWLNFTRYFNSDLTSTSTIGHFWRHTYSRKVDYIGAAPTTVVMRHEDGKAITFSLAGGQWSSDPDIQDTLTEQVDASGNATGWTHFRADTRSTEHYDGAGKLSTITDAQGFIVTLAYSTSSTPSTIAPAPDYLITVTDPMGRTLQLTYDSTGALATVTDPAGQVYHYALSSDASGNLGSVTYPGTATPRTYLYNEPAHTQSASFIAAMTGVIDENNARYTTIDYDTAGNAIGTQHANGADKFTLAYNSDGSSDVTDPLNNTTHHTFVVVNGVVRAATLSGPSIGFADGAARSYDTYGNQTSKTDFNGVQTCSGFDVVHGLETRRVEGVTTGCSGTPTGIRSVQTTWDTTLRLPTQRQTINASGAVEAQTRWTYNARGQTTARCEADPAVSGATTYACGSLATAPAGVRQWLTTYCEQADVTAGTCPLVGLTKFVNGPRATTDAGMAGLDDTTTYTYYQTDDSTCATNGACPHRKGDLWKVTNALSQITTYVTYDKNGRVTRLQDANGTYTDFVYHPRGWLTDRIVRASATGATDPGDATTHIDYDAVGNVTKVTQPPDNLSTGAYLAYTYDDAHRLIKIADNLNNAIDYCPGGVGSATCLDAAGNRQVEQVKDPSGVLKRSLSRTYNQLSQLTQVLNHASQPVEHSNGLSDTGVADGYDGNGNRVLVQDGLNTTTKQTYDGLNRLVATIQNYGGTDTATANTTTGYTYDTRDNLRQVTDPDGLNTVYTYDGLNNLTGLSSPDTGNSIYTYDTAGNRVTQTDNRSPSVTSTYTYDALNRLTGIAYPTTTLNVTYAYDQANATTGCTTSYPIGRLTTMTDGSGSTTYCYDRRGNVTQKKQITSSVTLTTQYSYTLADRLASLTYPSGAIVTYSRDTVGRITTVTWKANATATATTLVSNATYYPFGPLNVLTFGNGRTLTKTYDQDYAIDSVASSASTGLKLDLGVDVMGDIVQASGSIAPTTPDRQYGYDPLYRLTTAQTGAATPSPLEAYAYGKTGDRLSASLNGATPTAYAYTAGSHRLASVGGAARTYDGNGNTQTGVATGFTFTYDDKNRLSKATKTGSTFTYTTNGRGERVRKAQSGLMAGSTDYSYDESGQLLGDYAGTGGAAQTEYVYLDGTPIAVVKGTSLAYVETDHLGTPRQVVDPATNTALWVWDFLASTFGASVPNQSPTGGAAYTLNLRLPGQYYDAETGLNYNYFRDYEPATGRYAESDPIGLRGGLSTFDYGLSSPLIISDSYGLSGGNHGLFCAIGGGLGMAVGFVVCSPTGPGALVCSAAAGAVMGGIAGCSLGMAASLSTDLPAISTTRNDQGDCPCTGYPSRTEAFLQASAHAGMGPDWTPIGWSQFNMPGDKLGQINYTQLRQKYPGDPYGYSGPNGGEVVEHPADADHKCPHFHAKKTLGDSHAPFPYDPGKP